MKADPELAHAIQVEYARFEKFLEEGLLNVMKTQYSQYPELMDTLNRRSKPYFVAFYNLGSVSTIRALKSEHIGLYYHILVRI